MSYSYGLNHLLNNYIFEYNFNIILLAFSLLLLYFSMKANIKTLQFKLVPIFGGILLLSIFILERRIGEMIDLKGKGGVPLFTWVALFTIIFSISSIIIYIVRKQKERK